MAFFLPSHYQRDIFTWFEGGQGNAAVNAVAGSGKTTTIIRGLDRIEGGQRALFAAFNKSIVTELQSRLPQGVACQTIHSIGYGAIRRANPGTKWNIDDQKYKAMAGNFQIPASYGDKKTYIECVLSLLRFAQSTLTPVEPERLAELADRFAIEIPPCGIEPVSEAVAILLEKGIEKAENEGIISFGDMLWLPGVRQYMPDTYDLVCVDEAQDLSKAQMELVMRSMNGRMIAVGDLRQAIYMFAGAESDSFYQLANIFSAEQLPLSICYRCPISVVREAQHLVPNIEAAEDAPVGVVDSIQGPQFRKMLNVGDLVLCRTTAPLVKLCLDLLSRRLPATIKGRDIASSLTSLVEQIGKRAPFHSFLDTLSDYEGRQIAALEKKLGTEGQIEALRDRCEAIRAMFASFAPMSARGFISDIESLFSEPDGKSRTRIMLSTVHRAKGLENPRVFIIHPEKLPLVWKNQTPAQAQQELNLRYVAITRAQSELFYVQTDQEVI